jgi:thiamine-monophosphate kinase
MTEDQHITRWLKQWHSPKKMPLGPGDDCAVLPEFPKRHQPVWKTDAIVQDVHFQLSDKSYAVGHKALARVLSDFAAMGARPHYVLVTVGLPVQVPAQFIDGCYRGMSKLAQKFRLCL